MNKGIIPFIRDWVFPEKSIGMPQGNFKMADGITLHSTHKVPFADRLRILFGGGLHIVALVACEKTPVQAVASVAFNPLPPFSLPKEDKNQTKLPL